MIHPLDQSIIELLNASRDDEENLSLPVNDRTFGFHAQQAVEKLLKALIGAHEQKYKYTHDLAELLLEVAALDEHLPIDTSAVERLTEYAGLWRYQEPETIPLARRSKLRDAITALRAYVLGPLGELRPDQDWTAFE